MANHVHFNINLDLDSGQVALLEDTMKKVETENGEMKWKSWTAEELPIYPNKYDEKDWYGWGCENMGAKWVSIEDYQYDNISGYSAWSPPNPMVENLVQYIFDKVGGDVRATMTYEDEFRNYIGKSEFWIENGQCDFDIEEIDGDELHEVFCEWSGWDTSSEDFSWWDLCKAKNGEEYEPQEVFDEMVYGFFEDGKVEVRHD